MGKVRVKPRRRYVGEDAAEAPAARTLPSRYDLNMLPRVIITETLDRTCADWLAARTRLERCPYDDDTGRLGRLLAEAEGLVVRTYTRVDEALLAKAPKLKVVGRAGVGLDNIDVAACRVRGIEVVYTPDANSQAVAEYVVALILDAVRPRPTLSKPVDAETFHHLRREEVGRQLDEMTLGIIGFGRVGKRLGRIAHGIGMNLWVNDLIDEAELRPAVDYPFTFGSLQQVCERSDVVTVHVDGRAENRRLIGAEVLGWLKPECLFINASRGFVVDAPALAEWARRVDAAGGQAALDVHDPEPIPMDYPLYGLRNVRILPHVASRTTTAMRNMSWVVRDVAAVLTGSSPDFPAP